MSVCTYKYTYMEKGYSALTSVVHVLRDFKYTLFSVLVFFLTKRLYCIDVFSSAPPQISGNFPPLVSAKSKIPKNAHQGNREGGFPIFFGVRILVFL